MAGIGFELKKLFAQKGLLLKLRANTFASIVVAGPMVLGVSSALRGKSSLLLILVQQSTNRT